MVPLVSDVYTTVRAIMGDTKTLVGEIYKDAILQPHYQLAYGELFRALQGAQSPRVRQESYYDVPALTSYLNPATAGILNMGQIESVEERGTVTSWSVASFTPGVGFATVVTTTPHTLVSGNRAVLFGVVGVTDDALGMWTVTVVNNTTVRLDGCTAVLSGTETGGTLSYSAEVFVPLRPYARIDLDLAPSTTLGIYAWETGVIRFPAASGVVQLRITYRLSGNAPVLTTVSTGIDDCLGFLSMRVAGSVCTSRAMVQRAAVYNNQAVGLNWEKDGIPGGILNQLLQPGVRGMQNLTPSQRRSPPFGGIRSRSSRIW